MIAANLIFFNWYFHRYVTKGPNGQKLYSCIRYLQNLVVLILSI